MSFVRIVRVGIRYIIHGDRCMKCMIVERDIFIFISNNFRICHSLAPPWRYFVTCGEHYAAISVTFRELVQSRVSNLSSYKALISPQGTIHLQL